MNEEKIKRIKAVIYRIRGLRRKYNNILNDVANGEYVQYNGEDLVRLVGTLEAAYNHALVAVASDGDIYCLLKHISYAIILAGEMDAPNVEELYEIMTIVSDGRIEPCSSCKQEEKMDNKKGAQDE